MPDEKFFAHEKSIVESKLIGEGTKIWAFAHVMQGARIGKNCNIGDHCYIESDVTIGDDVVVKNGVSIWNRVRIGDRVFVGPGATFINDPYPRSKIYRDEYIATYIGEGASIGANATLMCGITVGEYSMIGAGSVVTRDVPSFSLIYGNPAKVRGYVCRCGQKLDVSASEVRCSCGESYKFSPDKGLESVGSGSVT
jgi:acetyltransferase-like isoleucine patch superfamily enzyme